MRKELKLLESSSNRNPFLFLQECDGERVQSESPYMLFYELQGLDYLSYLPNTTGKMRDSSNEEDDLEETKKSCRLQ